MSHFIIDGQPRDAADTSSLIIDVEVDAAGPRLTVASAGAGPQALTHEVYAHGNADDLPVVLRGPRGYCTFAFSVRDGDFEQLRAEVIEQAETPVQQQSGAEPTEPGRWVAPANGAWPRASLDERDICTTIVPVGYYVRFKVVLVSRADGSVAFVDPIIRNGTLSGRTRRR